MLPAEALKKLSGQRLTSACCHKKTFATVLVTDDNISFYAYRLNSKKFQVQYF